jgi:hypothetical protein
MDSMLKNASSSVNIVTTPVGLNELFENHLSMLKSLKQKGVKIKVAAKIDETCDDAVKALSGIAEIRKISEEKIPVSGRFFVVDSQQLMMGLSDPKTADTQHMVFWTKSEHAAKDLVEPLFSLVWEKTVPISFKK